MQFLQFRTFAILTAENCQLHGKISGEFKHWGTMWQILECFGYFQIQIWTAGVVSKIHVIKNFCKNTENTE